MGNVSKHSQMADPEVSGTKARLAILKRGLCSCFCARRWEPTLTRVI